MSLKLNGTTVRLLAQSAEQEHINLTQPDKKSLLELTRFKTGIV